MVEKTIEITGVSADSIEEAVALAVSRASVTIEAIRQVHVVDIRADVEDGVVAQWRVAVKISFALQDRLHE